MVECSSLGCELRVGLEGDGVRVGIIDGTDVSASSVQCGGSLWDIGGVTCSSYRVVLRVLHYPVTCSVIDNLAVWVVPPLPYHVGVMDEISYFFPPTAARGKVS